MSTTRRSSSSRRRASSSPAPSGRPELSTGCEVTWGHGESAIVHGVEDLDELLDRIDAEARSAPWPQSVGLTDAGGRGTLSIVLGGERSVLSHVPADAMPPYLTSVGDEEDERPFVFYVSGDHHTENEWRQTVTLAVAREAAREFVRSGRLDDRVRWEQV